MATSVTDTPWVHKHAPKRLADIVGHDAAIAKIATWLAGYRPGGKPLLLAGKPGIGKTSIAYALAREHDRELLEINASDSRNKDAIESIVGQAAVQASLFGANRIILVDEVDGVSGTKDRGGIAALVAVFEKSRYPIICTANDLTADKLKPLKKACVVVELADVAPADVVRHLRQIAEREGMRIDDQQLRALSQRAGGDVRSAVNDMQSLHGGMPVTKADVDALSERVGQEQIEHALMRVFKTTSADVARPAFEQVDEDVDGLLLWIDENIAREYKSPEDLARVFDALAEADKFFGRIRKWQYYRYYVYIYDLLTAGIALAKEKKAPGLVEYKRPERILKMWIYKQKNAKRESLAKALAAHTHTSAKRVRNDTLPFLQAIAKADKTFTKRLAAHYDLSDDDAAWLVK
jgi:replication factor C large subunit